MSEHRMQRWVRTAVLIGVAGVFFLAGAAPAAAAGWSDDFNDATWDSTLGKVDPGRWSINGQDNPFPVRQPDGTVRFAAHVDSYWDATRLYGNIRPKLQVTADGVEARVTLARNQIVDPVTRVNPASGLPYDNPFSSAGYFDLAFSTTPNDVVWGQTVDRAFLRIHVSSAGPQLHYQFGYGTGADLFEGVFFPLPGSNASLPVTLILQMYPNRIQAIIQQNGTTLAQRTINVAFSSAVTTQGVGPVMYQGNFAWARTDFWADSFQIVSPVGGTPGGPSHKIISRLETLEGANPIPGVQVRLEKLGTLVSTAVSDGTGRVEFASLPDGDYQVVPKSKAYRFLPRSHAVSLTSAVGDVQTPPLKGEPLFPKLERIVPGVIEFENFDEGTQGQTFNDLTAGNNGTKYRESGVDIRRNDDPLGGGYSVNDTQAGEWMQYTVTVPASGQYQMGIRVGRSAAGAGSLTAVFDGLPARQLGPVSIPVPPAGTVGTAWSTILLTGAVQLDAGTHLMRITLNGTVRDMQLNYLQMTPQFVPIPTPTTIRAVTGLVAGEVSDPVAVSNGQRIQQAVDALPSAGGVVTLPAGLFYVRQGSPVEGPNIGSENNAVVFIRRSNLVLRGVTGQTRLKAKNRSTSFLHIGNLWEGDGRAIGLKNVLVEGIIFTGNPFTAPNGQQDLDGINQVRFNWSLGAAITLLGQSPQQWMQSIHIRNCEFVDLPNVAIMMGNVKDVMIEKNKFTFFSGGVPAAYGGELNLPHPRRGIFAGGLRVENIQVAGNSFTGNPQMTSTNTASTDGFVWLSQGGNWTLSDNDISNFRSQGVLVDAGPVSMVRNRFSTPAQTAANFIAGHVALGTSLSSATSIYTAFDFVGNTVSGGSSGIFAGPPYDLNAPASQKWNAPYTLQVSGNQFSLPPFVQWSPTRSDPSAAVIAGFAKQLWVAGNTLQQGGRGLQFAGYPDRQTAVAANLQVRCNDFQKAASLAFLDQEYQPVQMERVTFLSNWLGRGNAGTAHLHFDNVYTAQSGVVTQVVGVGNRFYNNQTVQAEPGSVFYRNPNVIQEDIREDSDLFLML